MAGWESTMWKGKLSFFSSPLPSSAVCAASVGQRPSPSSCFARLEWECYARWWHFFLPFFCEASTRIFESRCVVVVSLLLFSAIDFYHIFLGRRLLTRSETAVNRHQSFENWVRKQQWSEEKSQNAMRDGSRWKKQSRTENFIQFSQKRDFARVFFLFSAHRRRATTSCGYEREKCNSIRHSTRNCSEAMTERAKHNIINCGI